MLNIVKGKKGFQTTTGSATTAKGLIGKKECHCTQFCEIPDLFCTDCEGTGTIQRLQEYLKKHGMEKTTHRIKRNNRVERLRG